MSDEIAKQEFEKWYCDLYGVKIDNDDDDFLNYGNPEIAIAFLAFCHAWDAQSEVIEVLERELYRMKAYFSH